MIVARLAAETDFSGWQAHARRLTAANVRPEAVQWIVGDGGALFADDDAMHGGAAGSPVRVPSRFIALCRDVVLHTDPQRFALLYRLLWRLRGEPRLLQVATDADVARARLMQKAINRDIHKMHAYVRFRESNGPGGAVYIAWFEPTHHILEAAAPFFVRRFASMRWSILTPERSAYWDGAALHFGPGATRAEAPDSDRLEALWQTYYASIFNPARLKVGTMQGQMPKKYWANLPEAALIPALIDGAARRTRDMIDAAPSQPRRRIVPYAHAAARAGNPADGGLAMLRRDAAGCRKCPLWEHATQTVFGEGSERAAVVFVGEQPGDREDLVGRPFVGPAGQLFDRALAAAGLERSAVYLTNAVKHFKFEPRGKRRLHRTPGQLETEACRDWLERELDAIDPRLVVALGATALRALTGLSLPIEEMRGTIRELKPGRSMLVTPHPASILRSAPERQRMQFERWVSELALAAPYCGGVEPARRS